MTKAGSVVNAQPISVFIFPFKFKRLLFSLWGDFIDLKVAITLLHCIYARASHLSDFVNSSIWVDTNIVHLKILYFF